MHEWRTDRGERGFTLIELLVVMIIVAILMAIAVPTFLSQKSNAQKTKALSNLKAIITAAETCAANRTDGTYGECAHMSSIVNYDAGLEILRQTSATAVGQYDIDAIHGDTVYPNIHHTAQGFMVWTSIQDGDKAVWFAEIHRENGDVRKWCGEGTGIKARDFGSSSATPPTGVPGSRACPTGRWG